MPADLLALDDVKGHVLALGAVVGFVVGFLAVVVGVTGALWSGLRNRRG
ncbi:hypothetical protein [Streptomyces sp. NPDC001292]